MELQVCTFGISNRKYTAYSTLPLISIGFSNVVIYTPFTYFGTSVIRSLRYFLLLNYSSLKTVLIDGEQTIGTYEH